MWSVKQFPKSQNNFLYSWFQENIKQQSWFGVLIMNSQRVNVIEGPLQVENLNSKCYLNCRAPVCHFRILAASFYWGFPSGQDWELQALCATVLILCSWQAWLIMSWLITHPRVFSSRRNTLGVEIKPICQPRVRPSPRFSPSVFNPLYVFLNSATILKMEKQWVTWAPFESINSKTLPENSPWLCQEVNNVDLQFI